MKILTTGHKLQTSYEMSEPGACDVATRIRWLDASVPTSLVSGHHGIAQFHDGSASNKSVLNLSPPQGPSIFLKLVVTENGITDSFKNPWA